MPTGFTAKVADGTVTELKPFVLQCARAFGALVTMRDEPWDAPLPEKLELSDYYPVKIVEIEKQLAELEAMTIEQAEEAQEAEIAKAEHRADKYAVKLASQSENYKSMIAKVREWSGAPEGIKEFALSQLEESLEWDCGGSYTPKVPDKVPATVWLASEKAELVKDLTFYKRRYAEELSVNNEQNTWLKQLRESLK